MEDSFTNLKNRFKSSCEVWLDSYRCHLECKNYLKNVLKHSNKSYLSCLITPSDLFSAFSATMLVIFNDLCHLVSISFKVQYIHFEIWNACFMFLLQYFKSIKLLEITVLGLNTSFNIVSLPWRQVSNITYSCDADFISKTCHY